MDANLRSLAAVRALIAYMAQHPHASDTIDGIHRWWLLPSDDQSVCDVAEALAWMQQERGIEVHAAADGRMRYRRSEHFDADALLALATRHFTGIS